jgi:hypothetical protein
MLATVFVAAIVIPLGLLILQPGMHLYRGLSGLDSALFALLCVSIAREHADDRRWVVVLAGLGLAFLLKSAIELFSGAAVFVDTSSAGFAAVPLAHLLGAAVGLAGLRPDRYAGGFRRLGAGRITG